MSNLQNEFMDIRWEHANEIERLKQEKDHNENEFKMQIESE